MKERVKGKVRKEERKRQAYGKRDRGKKDKKQKERKRDQKIVQAVITLFVLRIFFILQHNARREKKNEM